jgi:membrane protease YdiL (CAAX protease family)
MTLFALSTGARIAIVAAGAVIVWTVLAALVADYGRGKGFPFWPLFLSGLALAPAGWALVLLGVTLAGGRESRSPDQGL